MSLNAPTPIVLIAENIACRRGGRRVFSNLNLQLGVGQALWLRGPNGSGKTSLLRILAGLARPDSGSLRWVAGPGPAGSAAPAGRPGFIGHSNALNDGLSAGEALSFLCSLRGRAPERSRQIEALARFGLAHRIDMPVRRLSQGQRRKTALARLWLDEAAIWLLDEPYDALDREGCAVLDEALGAHLQRGGSLVMTSHQAVTLAGVQDFDLALIPQCASRRAVQ